MSKFLKLYEAVVVKTRKDISKNQYPFHLYVNDKKYNSYKTEQKCLKAISILKKKNPDDIYDMRLM